MLPPSPIQEARVHAIEVCSKERRLIAARTGADFDDRRTIVERIRRNEQWLELTLELLDALFRARDLRARLSGELFVVNENELACLRELVIEFL